MTTLTLAPSAFARPVILPLGITFEDLFCGAGGSSTGLVEAGYELVLAVNHWPVAVETHAANHRDAEHWCENVNHVDMRRLPPADVLWASPICTEGSPAGGRPARRSNRSDGQIAIEELGHVPQAGFEKTRATFWDVIRATEVRRYKAVIVENVPDIAWRWELLDMWCQCMIRLGYRMQILSASSAHLGDVDGNDPAPQWRNRTYFVFTRDGIPLPDLAPRPAAWCPVCESVVEAAQYFKPPTKRRAGAKLILGHPIGKYREQYVYICPKGHAEVEPYVRPAATVIDWSNLGSRIGDRKDPLAASTMARIRAGLIKYPLGRSVVTLNHGGHDGRTFPADTAPLPSRTAKIGEGILVPSGGTWNHTATTTLEPMRTRLANPKGFEALVTGPGGPEAFVLEYRNHADMSPATDPLATVTAQGNHHALVVPYRNAKARPADQPIHTLATRDSAALVRPAVEVEDCWFRMLGPREQLGAQRFPGDYRVHGNIGEQTAQAGNAVSVNAARFIGTRLAPVLI